MKNRSPEVVGDPQKTDKLVKLLVANSTDPRTLLAPSLHHLITRQGLTKEQAERVLGLTS